MDLGEAMLFSQRLLFPRLFISFSLAGAVRSAPSASPLANEGGGGGGGYGKNTEEIQKEDE